MPDLAQFIAGQVKLPAGARRVQQLPAQRRAGQRRAGDPRRQPHHGDPELQGVLPVAVRARGRGPELHRQRRVHALPAGWRRLPGIGGHRAPSSASATSPPSRWAPARRGAPSRRTSPRSTAHTQPAPDLNSAKIGPPGREAPDQEAGPGLRGDHRALRRGDRDRRLHPVQPALLPARLGARRGHGLLRGEGRAAHRPGRGARPGSDGERRRREGGRGGRGQARGRPRRGDDADQGRVQADLQGRDDPAASRRRPEGHDPRPRSRHEERRRDRGGRAGAGWPTPFRT